MVATATEQPVFALSVTPCGGVGPGGRGERVRRPRRQAVTILALLREPLARATVHTLSGTAGHLVAESQQVRSVG